MIITLPSLNPIALDFGFIAIRWYSIAYIAGILIALSFLKNQNKKYNIMSRSNCDDWLTWSVLSIIIGGRIGYVIFYNIGFFIENPLEIIAVWHGGMSFHGGLIGAIIGMFLFCRLYKINFLQLTDIIAIIAPIGLFFGRIANFINMELYGRVTNSNFGVIFPNAGDFPRHPSQLYEAFLEGILLFVILFFVSKFSNAQEKKGAISGLFLIFYGLFRIIAENFREPDVQIGFLVSGVTMGQILSLPLILIGIFVFFKSIRKNLQ